MAEKHPPVLDDENNLSRVGVPCKNELNDIREGTPIPFAKYDGCPKPNAEKMADAQAYAWKQAGIGIFKAVGALFAGQALATGHAVRSVVEVAVEHAALERIEGKVDHSSHQGSSNPYPAGSEDARRYTGMNWLLRKDDTLTGEQRAAILECIKERIDSGSLVMGPKGNVDTIAECKGR